MSVTVSHLTVGKSYTCTVATHTAAGAIASSRSTSLFVARLSVSVTKIGPVAGAVGGGTKVTIAGKRLQRVTEVLFGAVPAASFTVNDKGTSIAAIAPAHAAGTVHVIVLSLEGVSLTSSSDLYTFSGPTVKKISSPRSAR